ncbi:ATP-binding protein [Actinokineospora sp. NPDC004072]
MREAGGRVDAAGESRSGILPVRRELRRRREERGLSLSGLASLLHYSRGYIGKIETGDKPPTTAFARRCDEALAADGELLSLVGDGGIPRCAQLPAAAATFVGRREQLSQLSQALAEPQQSGAPRVVAIDGPPGMGKTALALRLAHHVKDRFPDGQLYVNLRGYSQEGIPARPAIVLEDFLVSLGVQAGRIPTNVDQRAAFYRSLLDGRQVLVVLDNARDLQQINPLLPAADSCGVIITSRTRITGLEIAEAQRSTLGPMSDDESISLLRGIIGTRDGDRPGVIGTLAERCGHMPLALRIAAELVAMHPHHAVHDLVSELGDEQDRLEALATGDTHQIRTVFSWSYRDLDDATRRLFRLLGMHQGPDISIDGAAALTGLRPSVARRLLDRLVSMHLVEGVAGVRYQMHDLLRVYATERAVAEEPPEDLRVAVQRLVDFYLHASYHANGILAPQRPNPELPAPRFDLALPQFTEYDEALTWCEQELANLVGATRLALDIGEYEAAWKLPVGLWNFLYLRKRWSSWIACHQMGLEAARECEDRFGEAWVLNNLAMAFRELRRFDEARNALDRALEVRRGVGDRIGEAWTLTSLGFLESDEGHYEEAAHRFQQALGLRSSLTETDRDRVSEVGNLHGQSIALAYLGVVLSELRRYDEAHDCLQQALAIARHIDDRHGESYTLIKVSDTYRKQRSIPAALNASVEALRIRREIGDRWGEAEVLHHQGHILLDDGQTVRTARAWVKAEAIFDELGDPRANDVRSDLAQLARAQGVTG